MGMEIIKLYEEEFTNLFCKKLFFLYPFSDGRLLNDVLPCGQRTFKRHILYLVHTI
jgi:hypothetical protein